MGAPATPEVEAHLTACGNCAVELGELRQTMALLDTWEAPEPTPYFDTRLQARLREEQQKKQTAGWFAWLRRPSMGIAAAAVLALGIGIYEGAGHRNGQVAPPPTNASSNGPVTQGTAVGDLQFLDNHADLLQDFEAVDGGEDVDQVN